jgi:hypothetical protein
VIQRVQVDLRRKEYIVWSASQTVSGIWRMNGSFRRLPATATAGELGVAIEWALAQSRTGTPDLTNRRGPIPFQPVLDDLGLSSYGQYTKGTRMTAVEREDDVASVIPYVNNGPRQGFSAALDQTVRLVRATGEQVAEAVTNALAGLAS